jgi:hypothetical protein
LIFVYIFCALLAVSAILFSILVVKVGQARRASKKPNCAHCGSMALHVSAPRGPIDRLLTHWDCIPHRCEVCFRRQYRLADRPGKEDL